ncbi:hypothetical protein [Brevibacillus sp. H7]|uniref:hypothetical protein n=1 Tax=Brevibacillus sp. H7 TaxID=3349138 RepID=UPI0037F27508
MVNDQLKAALANHIDETTSEAKNSIEQTAATTDTSADTPQIVTTEAEIEGYVTIKLLLKETVSNERIYYRDNLSYFKILLDNNIRKWICRLGLNGSNKYIQFNDEAKTTYNIEKIDDLISYKEKINETAKKFL